MRMIPVNEPNAEMIIAMVLDTRGSNKFSKKSDWLFDALVTSIAKLIISQTFTENNPQKNGPRVCH